MSWSNLHILVPMSYSPFATPRGQGLNSCTPNHAHRIRGTTQQPQYQYIEPGRYATPATSYISPYSPPTSEHGKPFTTYTIRPQQALTTKGASSRGIYSPPISVSPPAVSSYSSFSSRSGYRSSRMSVTSGRLSAVSIIYNSTYPHNLPILCHSHHLYSNSYI